MLFKLTMYPVSGIPFPALQYNAIDTAASAIKISAMINIFVTGSFFKVSLLFLFCLFLYLRKSLRLPGLPRKEPIL